MSCSDPHEFAGAHNIRAITLVCSPVPVPHSKATTCGNFHKLVNHFSEVKSKTKKQFSRYFLPSRALFDTSFIQPLQIHRLNHLESDDLTPGYFLHFDSWHRYVHTSYIMIRRIFNNIYSSTSTPKILGQRKLNCCLIHSSCLLLELIHDAPTVQTSFMIRGIITNTWFTP